jgi:hypothetical protein
MRYKYFPNASSVIQNANTFSADTPVPLGKGKVAPELNLAPQHEYVWGSGGILPDS